MFDVINAWSSVAGSSTNDAMPKALLEDTAHRGIFLFVFINRQLLTQL